MLKWHTVTLYHIITVYNDMFNHMDSIMQAVDRKKIQCKEGLYFTLKLACQKVFKHYAEVTPTTGMICIWAHILYPFRKLPSVWKRDNWMTIDPDDETFYTT